MTSSLLLETTVSLIVQLAILVAFALLFDRWGNSARRSGRIWTATFAMTLLLTLNAFLLPHVRWITLPEFAVTPAWGTVFRYQVLAIEVLFFVWLTGFCAGLVLQTYRYLSLTHFLSFRCRTLHRHEFANLPQKEVSRAPNGTRWLLSKYTHGPFCWQMQRPAVVLPESFFRLNAEMQPYILRHELEHLRVGHPVQHFLQGFCNILFWFHPSMRAAARRAELTREYWCDEVATEGRQGVADYLRSLYVVSLQDSESPTCTLALGRNRSAIVRRSSRLATLMKQDGWIPGREDQPLQAGLTTSAILLVGLLMTQVWLPVNLLASSSDRWSPWPTWTARVLHDNGITVRDYESFDHRREAHELLYPDD